MRRMHCSSGCSERRKSAQARRAFALEQIVNHGPAKIEIGQQNGLFQLRLRECQIDRREALAFGGRCAGYYQRMKILLALQMVETCAQAAEFLVGNLMGPLDINEMRLRGGAIGDYLAARQEIAPVDGRQLLVGARHSTAEGLHVYGGLRFRNARLVADRERDVIRTVVPPIGSGSFAGFEKLLGAAQCFVNAAH